MSEFLTKEAIAGAKDHRFETVDVPEWGGSVGVRTLSGNEREAMWLDARARGEGTLLHGPLLVRALCDDESERLYKDGDLDELMDRESSVLDRLYDVAARLNGIRGDSDEEEEKNSETTPE